MKNVLQKLLIPLLALFIVVGISHQHADALTDLKYKATLKVKSGLYKNHPGSKRIGSIPKGASVTFHYTQSDSWAYVTYNGKKGYLMSAYLNIDDKGKSKKTYYYDKSKLYKYKVSGPSIFEINKSPTNKRPDLKLSYPYTSYSWYDKSADDWKLDPVAYYSDPLNKYKLAENKYELILYPYFRGSYKRSYMLHAYPLLPGSRIWDIPRTQSLGLTYTAKVQGQDSLKVGAGTFKDIIKVTYNDRVTFFIAPKVGIILERRGTTKVRELMSVTTNPNY